MAPVLKAVSCPLRHLGYCLSGVMHVVMDDGQQLDITPHTVFEVPPGHDKWVVGDEAWTAVEWGGTQRASRAASADAGAGALVTLVLTDIADSTARAVGMGDAAWRDALAEHNLRLREVLNLHRGREVATTGDGLLSVFESPTRAVLAAADMVRAAGALGLPIRAGVHTGEVERVGDDVRGVAVHTAARVRALARGGEVLVSATTAALLDPSAAGLEDAGSHSLKGLPLPVQVFRVVPEARAGT
jgi:class 3 adenylate cyclase